MLLRCIGRMAIASAVALALAGCGNDPSEKELIESARKLVDQSDNAGARVQVMSALQKNPSSAEARFLHGLVLLKLEQPGAAQIELRKARELGHPADEVTPVLARTMLRLQQDQTLITEFGGVKLASEEAQAELQAVIVAALTRQGKRDQATKLADDVLARLPDHVAMTLAKARLQAMTESPEKAIPLVDRILARKPDHVDALHLLGDLHLFGTRNLAAAEAAYRKVLAKNPADIIAHSALIAIQASKNDLAGAKKQHAELAKAAPNHPQTKFVESQLAYASGDLKGARELAERLLKAAPTDSRLLEFAAGLELRTGSQAQAERLFSKALSLTPDLIVARRELARIHLRAGQHGKALETLKPLLSSKSPGTDTLSLAAEAQLQAGNVAAAEELFNRALKMSPEDAQLRTALALTQFTKGETLRGFEQLQAIASTDKGVTADLALVSAHTRAGAIDQALRALDGLSAKEPSNPRSDHLRGVLLARKGDNAGARKSWEAAIAKDPGYFASVARLAALDVKAGNHAAAQKRFEDILKSQPTHLGAMMGMAELQAQQSAKAEDVAAWLDKAIAAHPAEAAPRVLLVDHWLSRGDAKRALALAQAAAAALPDHPLVINALGRTQLAAGEGLQAVATFGKLAALLPNSPEPLLRLSDAYRSQGDAAGSERNLKKALEISPGHLQAQRQLIDLTLKTKRYDRAIQMSKDVQRQRPTEAIGYLMEGDSHAAAKKFDDAITAYRAGLDRTGDSLLAIRAHTVLLEKKGAQEAAQFSAAWLKRKTSGDPQFSFYLGSQSLKTGDYAAAQKHFEDVVRLEPSNARAINNVAWILATTGKAGAIELAEKAVALEPKNAAMLETLALAQEKQGQMAKALETAQRASALAPRAPTLRLTLARLYLKNNDKAKAKAELDDLAKLGDKFSGQAEVSALLKGI